MTLIRPLRIGTVPYVNMMPLLVGLENDYPKKNWTKATPRELAEMLMKGEVDVAVVSSYEGIRRGYEFVPEVMIGCWGSVRSVALYSKIPFPQVKSILLDHASLTSVHLLRILCAEQLSIDPNYTISEAPITAGFDWKNDLNDAVLVIGDACLAWENSFPHTLDLGEAWLRLTGLPFVFAAWCLRPELQLTADEMQAFTIARTKGERECHVLCEQAVKIPPLTKVPAESIFEYLTGSIRYRMGKRELEALELFRQKLIKHKILPEETPAIRLAKPATQ